MIFVYLFNGKIYDGDIYFKDDPTNKFGFICAIDPKYNYLLTVIKVPYKEIYEREQYIIRKKFPNIFNI